jgi:hypothetical protein
MLGAGRSTTRLRRYARDDSAAPHATLRAAPQATLRAAPQAVMRHSSRKRGVLLLGVRRLVVGVEHVEERGVVRER